MAGSSGCSSSTANPAPCLGQRFLQRRVGGKGRIERLGEPGEVTLGKRESGFPIEVTAIAGALQPVFTIVLAMIFLQEKLGLIEVVGIGLAIIGSLFLSVEKKKNPLL